MKKEYIVTLVVAVLVGGGSFWGGMQYAQSSNNATSGSPFTGSRSQQIGGGRTVRGGNGGAAGFGTLGDVISKDDKSITIQLPGNAGTKFVFYSPTTTVIRTVNGTLDDVKNGESIAVMGTTNSDGSVTAQSIQIRPLNRGPFGSATQQMGQ